MTDAEAITMDAFRQACEDRLDYALETNEEGVERRATADIFETPAGLKITRYAGGLLVAELDHSELGDDADQKWVRVDFFPGDEPTHVYEEVFADGAPVNKTLKQSDHDRLAGELSKYVTLEV